MFSGLLGLGKLEFRPLLALGWNANVNHEGLAAQIDWAQSAGFGGLLIVPVRGLPYEFMADPWLDAVEFTLNRAKQHQLRVWICDDWSYPSGFGGGLVTADLRFRARRLHLAMDMILEPGQMLPFAVPEHFIAAGSVPINKHTAPAGTWKPLALEAGRQAEYCAGSRRERFLMVAWDYCSWHECTVSREDPEKFHSVNMLDPLATRRFLQVVHERYAERMSSHFGHTLRGFWYTEPTQAFPFPWAADFPNRFEARKGYDVRPCLPLMIACLSNLFTQADYDSYLVPVRQHMRDYFDVWTDLCAESFYGELERWCHDHGVLSIGHQDMDHRLYNLATVSGHFFKNSAHNDHPGIDAIWQQIVPGRFIDFPRYAGSVARALGKERAMSSSLSQMGWGMDADAMRYVLEHQIVRGISEFFLFWYAYDPGCREFAVDPDISPRNPVLSAFAPLLNERIGRLSALMNVGRPSVEVGLCVPMDEISLCQPILSHPHQANYHPMPWEPLDQIAEHVTYLPCEFDYIWEEALEALEVTNGGLKSRSGHIYRILILPPRYMPQPQITERLRAFCRSGGKLLAVEEAASAVRDVATLCPTTADLDKYLPRRVRIEPKRTRISLAGRVGGERELYLMLNEDTEAQEVTLSFPGQGELLQVDPDTGTPTLLATGDSLRTRCWFDATALHVFVVEPAGKLRAETILVEGDVPVVLSRWELSLPDGRTIRIEDGWPEWGELGFGQYSGWMTYKACFNWAGPMTTARLKLGEVRYGAEVLLDGKWIASVPFRPHQVLLSQLTPGEHRLQVRVLNTMLNEMCHTGESEELARSGILDRAKLRSGLLGPVTLTPCILGGAL